MFSILTLKFLLAPILVHVLHLHFTRLRQMELSVKFDIVMSGWSIVYVYTISSFIEIDLLVLVKVVELFTI